MQRATRAVALAAAVTLASAGVTACGGGASTASDSRHLTYWATQQGNSPAVDKAVLPPEIKKFTKETGIKVDMEVVPWPDLFNRILTATTSGKGPDVVNFGNTWSASLQATGAFVPWDKAMLDKVGGASRFVPAALKSTGAAGQDPVGLPLYNMAYQLYYNKKLFKAAEVGSPPKTWSEFVSVAKKLTKDTDGDGKTDQWGLGMRGAAPTAGAHFAYILGKQHGAKLFSGTTPKLDDEGMVDGIDQWLSWFGEEGIVNPSDAELTDTASALKNFASRKSAMVLLPTVGANMKEFKLTAADYGVAPMPSQDSPVVGARDVASFVGGTNVAIFKNTGNLDGATQFVKFLTSADEQVVLNRVYGTVPAVVDAKDPAFDTEEFTVTRETLAARAEPLPQIPEEAQFETLVGNAMNAFAAQTTTGKRPSKADIKRELAAVNQKLAAGS